MSKDTRDFTVHDAMKQDRKDRRFKRIDENWTILNDLRSAGVLAWDERGKDSEGFPVTLLFREAHRPKVDFYPGTGRWRVVGPHDRGDFGKTYRGGARAFATWYGRQT